MIGYILSLLDRRHPTHLPNWEPSNCTAENAKGDDEEHFYCHLLNSF
jgi:hypothetical protein